MLVKAKHYSVTYPTSTGMQNVGDIFDLPKLQADYYASIGWVEILAQELQPQVKRGKKKISINSPINLSNSKLVNRTLQHNFSQNK